MSPASTTDARLIVEAARWPDGPQCPYCGSKKASANNDASRALTAARWQCQDCRRSYSVTVGTVFHRSHISLDRWLLLTRLLRADPKITSMLAARELGLHQSVAWSMLCRLRAATGDNATLIAKLGASQTG